MNTIMNETLALENGILARENDIKDLWIECMNIEFTNIVNEADGIETPAETPAKEQEDKAQVKSFKEKVMKVINSIIDFFKVKVPQWWNSMIKFVKDQIVKLSHKNVKIKVDSCYGDAKKVAQYAMAFAGSDFYNDEDAYNKLVAACEKVHSTEKGRTVTISTNELNGFFKGILNVLQKIKGFFTSIFSKLTSRKSKVNSSNDKAEIAEAQKDSQKELKGMRALIASIKTMLSSAKAKKDGEEEKSEPAAAGEEN